MPDIKDLTSLKYCPDCKKGFVQKELTCPDCKKEILIGV